MSSRFTFSSEESVEERRLSINAQKTLKANKSAAKILKEYLVEMGKSADFEVFSVEELDIVLDRFWMDIRRFDGSTYEINSLESIRHAFNSVQRDQKTGLKNVNKVQDELTKNHTIDKESTSGVMPEKPRSVYCSVLSFEKYMSKLHSDFKSMFESRPELLEVFSKFQGRDLNELRRAGLLRQHALRVMATIDKVITRLDEPSSLIVMLREVGAHHKLYKVPPDYIKMILPHFLNAIKPHLEHHWCNDLEIAWKTMFAIIIYHIQEGMDLQDHGHKGYIVCPSS